MIKTIIIDDEPNSIVSTSYYIKKYSKSFSIVGTANTVDEGIQLINDKQPDLIFLDIEMPGKNGFDLLKHFTKPNFKVVFVTGHNNYAIKAIKFSALDYIMKPIDAEEFRTSLDRVTETFINNDSRLEQLQTLLYKDEPNYLMIYGSKVLTKLYFKEIEYIQGMQGGYSVFFTTDSRKITTTKPLSFYENILPEPLFLRCHRSFLANTSKIFRIVQDNSCIAEFNNSPKIPVSQRRIGTLKKHLKI